jgi:hypothetical protein
LQTIFHSSAVTGCTERREYFTSAMSVNRLSALIAAIWVQFAKKTGLRPEVFKRGAASGKEQAVDQALRAQMLRALIDEPRSLYDARHLSRSMCVSVRLQSYQRRGRLN